MKKLNITNKNKTKFVYLISIIIVCGNDSTFYLVLLSLILNNLLKYLLGMNNINKK